MKIHFGAFAPRPSTQIPGLSEKFDTDATALDRLNLRGILTDADTHRARRRLAKAIEKWAPEGGK